MMIRFLRPLQQERSPSDGSIPNFQFQFLGADGFLPSLALVASKNSAISIAGRLPVPFYVSLLWEGGAFIDATAYNSGIKPVSLDIPPGAVFGDVVALVTGHGDSTGCGEKCQQTHIFAADPGKGLLRGNLSEIGDVVMRP
jgi:hypothetical protein